MTSYIHSTTIVVNDQDKALDFYVKTLGWEKAIDNMMGPTMRFLTVVPPGAKTQLVLGHPNWCGVDRKPGETGVSLVSTDIDSDYLNLSQKGVKFKQPVEVMPWGSKATWFYDPDGNEFFLVEVPENQS